MPSKSAAEPPSALPAVDAELLEAVASAALDQIDTKDLRTTIVGLIAQKSIARLRPADMAQAIVDKHGAEIGDMLTRKLLGG